MEIILNTDLGEGEPVSRTRALMRLIGAANIACGGHAGSLRSMDVAIRLAVENGVRIGAHPGFAGGFGRQALSIDPSALEILLLQQVGGFVAVAARHGAAVHHVKLHGALYHAVENDARLARRYMEVVRDFFPALRIFGFAGGAVVRAAAKGGVEAWGEAFAERGYRSDGGLIPRGESGDLIPDAAEVARRVRGLAEAGWLPAVTGERVRIRARTICVHADSPNALRIARAAAKVLAK